MNRIEDELKAALSRKPAPPGFASRVMKRIEDRGSYTRNTSLGFMRNRLRILAVAAMAMIVAWIGMFAYQQHVRARNRAALQHTLAAISIAALHLDKAEKKAFETIPWDRLSRQLTELENNHKK